MKKKLNRGINRKVLSVLLAMVMAFSMLPFTALPAKAAESAVDTWDGTADTTLFRENPTATEYHITTAEQLAGLAQYCTDYYTLTHNNAFDGKIVFLDVDIVLNENVLNEDGELNSGSFLQWKTIGKFWLDLSFKFSAPFGGTFDGQGHTVSGMVIDVSGSSIEDKYSVGLFGFTSNALIKNLKVRDSYITGGINSGGIAGYATNSQFDRLVFDGTIKSDGTNSIDCIVGGVIGTMTVNTSTQVNENLKIGITNCVNLGHLELLNRDQRDSYCAGICGKLFRPVGNTHATVENCLNAGTQNSGKNISTAFAGNNNELNAYIHCYVLNPAPGETGYDDPKNSLPSDYNYITDAQLASGMVAYALNQYAGNEYFGQNIGTDKAPVLGGAKVYQVPCENSYGYSNTNEAHTAHTYANGVCSFCLYEHPESEHSWVLSNITPATCGADGSQDKTCSVCGKQVIGEVIPATKQHTYDSNNICTVCGFTDCASTGEHIYDANGFCIGCDGYEPAVYNSTTGFCEVSNAGQLFWVSANYGEKIDAYNRVKSVRLMKDIDLNPGYTFYEDGTYSGGTSPRQWIPLGSNKEFYHSFDGQGYTVENMYINSATLVYGGLIYYARASISDIIIKDVSVTGYVAAKYGSAGIVGGAADASNNLTISGCSSYVYLAPADTKYGKFAGGIIGDCGALLTISDCANYGNITYPVNTANTLGGIVGRYLGEAATLHNCLNTGVITGVIEGQNNLSAATTNVTYNNCYSLNETATVDGITSLTAEELASTLAAWDLNSAKGTAQNSGMWAMDTLYPVLKTPENKAVYRVTVSGALDATYYTNQNGYVALPGDYNYTCDGTSFSDSNVITKDVTLLATDIISDIISVDIEWGSMEFTYVDASVGTWNPETLSYENPTTAWTCDADANKITVTSESTMALTASFSYEQAEGVTVTGSFTDGTDPITAALPIAKGNETPQTVAAYLKLDGKPEETANKTVVGTVTVTIGE